MTQVNVFTFLITVPANTTEDTLILGGDSVGILTGILKKIHVAIPNGVAFVAGVRINFNNKHKIPSGIKGGLDYISGNANPDMVLLAELPLNEVKPEFYGLNNSATNDHSFIVTLEVEQ